MQSDNDKLLQSNMIIYDYMGQSTSLSSRKPSRQSGTVYRTSALNYLQAMSELQQQHALIDLSALEHSSM